MTLSHHSHSILKKSSSSLLPLPCLATTTKTNANFSCYPNTPPHHLRCYSISSKKMKPRQYRSAGDGAARRRPPQRPSAAATNPTSETRTKNNTKSDYDSEFDIDNREEASIHEDDNELHLSKQEEAYFKALLGEMESKQHGEDASQSIIGRKKKPDELTQQQFDKMIQETRENLQKLDSDDIFKDFEKQMLNLEEEIWNEFRSSGEPVNAQTVSHVQSVIAETKENLTDFYKDMPREEMQRLLKHMQQHEKEHPIQDTPLNSFFKQISGRDIASHPMTEEELNRFFQIMSSKEKGRRFKRQLRKLLPDKVIASFGYDPQHLKDRYGDDAEDDKAEDGDEEEDYDEEDILPEDQTAEDSENAAEAGQDDDQDGTENAVADAGQDDDVEDLTYEQIRERMKERNELYQNGYPEGMNVQEDPSLQKYIKEHQLDEQVQEAKKRKRTQSAQDRHLHEEQKKQRAQEQASEEEAYHEQMAQNLFDMDPSSSPFGGTAFQDMEDYQIDNWKHLMRKQFEEDPYMKELFEKEFGTDTDDMIESFAQNMGKRKD